MVYGSGIHSGTVCGSICGSAVVYLLFKGQFDATEDQAAKLGVFCIAPSIPNLGLNIFSEAVGTFILVFAIKGMANVPELTDGLGKFIVFGIIVSIGMSLGGLTGYAINPARDLGHVWLMQYFQSKEKEVQTGDTVS